MSDRTSHVHRLYIITNGVNDKKYVGLTSAHFLSTRWGAHRDRARDGKDTYLYRAMRKYGIQNFSIEEIASCHNREELLRLEKFWIGMIHSNDRIFGYNQTHGGEAPKHTKETRKKISEIQKGRKLSEPRASQQREILSRPEIQQKRVTALKMWWAEAKKTSNHPFLRGEQLTPEQRKKNGQITGHRRWHVNRGIVSSSCKFCITE
jgi:group I intron endonuclease